MNLLHSTLYIHFIKTKITLLFYYIIVSLEEVNIKKIFKRILFRWYISFYFLSFFSLPSIFFLIAAQPVKKYNIFFLLRLSFDQ